MTTLRTWLACLAFLGIAGCAGDLCESVCEVEADCGLAASGRCQDGCFSDVPTDEVSHTLTADSCSASVEACVDVMNCVCASACTKRDACLGSTSATCLASCLALASQDVDGVYVEARCVLDQACVDLALCGNVSFGD